jgi:pyrimidine-nucleoside phosphorylase
MSFVEAIIRKRDGGRLSRAELERFALGAGAGDLPPEQLAAMLMAICIRGMDPDETRWLTEAMIRSGESWRFGAERPQVVDKHSTGGVGDTVSLVLAPLLAAVGVPVAMMAGRGLGHSQGTVDKLAAVPGFRTDWSRAEAIGLIDRVGVAMLAQTERIAPADRTLYALRDVTGTVQSLPLIVASIMSKKLAMGAAILVLDVKCGRGAFRQTPAEALELARALVGLGRAMGVRTEAILTDMNQPLGPALGTACEIREALAVLGGGGSRPLRELTVALARVALALAGRDPATAEGTLARALDDGSALAAWARVVEAHGGDPDPGRLARPRQTREIAAARSGFVTGVAAADLGWVAVDVGAGRRTRDEAIDHAAGLVVHVRIGDRVEAGQPLGTILLGERAVDLGLAGRRVREAFEIGEERVQPPPLILGTADALGACWA